MVNKTASSLAQEISLSEGIEPDTAALIAADFLSLNAINHKNRSGEIESFYFMCFKPGFDSYGFRVFIKEKYSLTDKQSSIIAQGFRHRCDSQKIINTAISSGVMEATWTFRSTCQWLDEHLSMNGKRFNLAKGMDIKGSAIKPGESWLCTCDFRPIIPDLATEKESAFSKLWKSIKAVFNKKTT